MEYRTVYITTANEEEARKIGNQLIALRLVACVNIIPGMLSIYRWQGEIHQDRECVLLAKTKQPLMKELIAKVRELHSYDVPCITSWSIREADADYLAWIDEQTG